MKHEKEIDRIFEIFSSSEAEIRPHFILTGPSGSGKSYTIAQMCEKHDLAYVEINAAALTKEGTSGNSLSKALAAVGNYPAQPLVCFVDEFDKLFISGNHNTDMAHETTNGVQNEFLKVLESDTASVFADYGKYVNIKVDHVLFVFAGAFNGELDIDLDRLRELGIKTEFLGRVGLTFGIEPVSLKSMIDTMKSSPMLANYLELFPGTKRKTVENVLTAQIKGAYDKNTLGYRLITTLLHQFFITGGSQDKQEAEKVTFKKALKL